jgi:ribulose-phosphate 3-epimerase
MSVVCPTVTASTVDEFQEQIAVASFAEYIHIDLADGQYAKASIDIKDIWLPEGKLIDIHLMYEKPFEVLPTLIALQPSLVIVHAEAQGDLKAFSDHLKEHGIRFGVGLVQELKVDDFSALIKLADHALIFSGNLGSFGGKADIKLLQKVSQLKALNPQIEIGWDGGINLENISALARGGVDVLNVGGAIQKAPYPENAYRQLVRRVGV